MATVHSLVALTASRPLRGDGNLRNTVLLPCLLAIAATSSMFGCGSHWPQAKAAQKGAAKERVAVQVVPLAVDAGERKEAARPAGPALPALKAEPKVAPKIEDPKYVPQTEIVRAALVHAGLQGDRACTTRYFDLGNIHVKERPEWFQTMSGHVHGLSREPDFPPLVLVDGTFGSLIAINIADFRWDIYLWGALRNEEPFYTVAGVDPKNPKERTLFPNPYVVRDIEKAKTWADLVLVTQSNIPVVRGDWFVNQTLASKDRAPNYHDFLGGKVGSVKTGKDFLKLVGFDQVLADLAGGPIRAAISESGVSIEPRGLQRDKTTFGSVWITHDFIKAAGRKNPLANIGADIAKQADAHEIIASLPNGCLAWALTDAKDIIQTDAPGFVGKDKTSRTADGRIHNASSCWRCHKNGGYQDIDDWIRNQQEIPFAINVIAPKGFDSLRQYQREYVRSLEAGLAFDRAAHELAIRQATLGWDSKTWSAKISAAFEWTEDAKLTLERGAAEVGVTPEVLRAVLAADVAVGIGDPVLSAWMQKPPRLRTVPWRQFLESLPRLYASLARAG